MAYDPVRHEAPVAPPEDPEPLRVDEAAVPDDVIRGLHDVKVVPIPPGPRDEPCELLSVSDTGSGIGVDDDAPVVGEDLELVLCGAQLEAVGAPGAPVDLDARGVSLPSLKPQGFTIQPWTSIPSLAVNQNSSGGLILSFLRSLLFISVSLFIPVSWMKSSEEVAASEALKAILDPVPSRLKDPILISPSVTCARARIKIRGDRLKR